MKKLVSLAIAAILVFVLAVPALLLNLKRRLLTWEPSTSEMVCHTIRY